MPKVSLIISVYKNTRFLKKVLDSLSLQVFNDFDVIIAEDGDSEEMKLFLAHYAPLNPVKIRHLTQEDKGFRKNKILNAAIRSSDSDLFVFIDGDCILHPKFMHEYVKYCHEKRVLFSKRTELDPKTTDVLLNTEQIIPRLFQMLKNKSSRVEDSLYLALKPLKIDPKPRLMGCNMAIPRKILFAVNGFDEDYESTGYGEDTDIEWRIQQAGFQFLNLKYKVIEYHLHHERFNRPEESKIGQRLIAQKQKEGVIFCKNGLVQ